MARTLLRVALAPDEPAAGGRGDFHQEGMAYSDSYTLPRPPPPRGGAAALFQPAAVRATAAPRQAQANTSP